MSHSTGFSWKGLRELSLLDINCHLINYLSVRQHVHLQCLSAIKLLLAEQARERLYLCHMHSLPVLVHQLGIIKGSIAVWTWVLGV